MYYTHNLVNSPVDYRHLISNNFEHIFVHFVGERVQL
jgi:hypothetical protein